MIASDHLDKWEKLTVADLGEIISGGTPSRTNLTFWNGQIPWVTPSEITSLASKYLDDTAEKITPDGLAACAARLLPVGSVVVTTRASLGGVAIARVPVATNQGFKSIIPNPQTDSLFCYYAIQAIRPDIKRLANGTTFFEISKSDFARIEVCRPPKTEQRKIAAILDAIDTSVAGTWQMITKLRQIRRGLIHDLLTRGLDENGELRDPIHHPEQFKDSRLGLIPREWKCSVFSEVLERIDAGQSPDYPDYPAPPGDWGVLKVSAIGPDGFRPSENKWITKANDQNPVYEIHDGDLLISRANTYDLVGLVCIVQRAPIHLMLSDKTLRLRPKNGRALEPFFALLLQMPMVRVQIEVNATGTSGSMKNISQEVIRALQLAYPEKGEQERILEVLSPLNAHLELNEKEFSKLVALRSGLMADLLTGRVRVPESIASKAA